MHTLLSALYAHAKSEPSRPAILFQAGTRLVQLAYGDLLEETERWAERFVSLRLPAQSIVALVLDHRIDMYGAYLGAMRAGLVASFLSYPTPKQDAGIYWHAQAGLFETLRPSCVVTYGDLIERVRDALRDVACVLIDVDALEGPPVANLPSLAAIEGDGRLALIQSSSGTTGAKKCVALTYEAIREQVAAHASALPASGNDRIVSWLPLYHDMGLFTAFLSPVTLGAAVVSFDAFDWLGRPASFFELVQRYAATHAWLPNFALNHLVRTYDPAETYDLSSLRAVVCCSEPCKPATLATFAATFEKHGCAAGTLRCSYAMAEAVFACTVTGHVWPLRTHTLATGDRLTAYLSCGRPLRGVEIRILAAGADGIGEIAVRANFMATSYLRDDRATSHAFEDGWFRTGDTGFLRDEELYVCGRIEEKLVVHGQNFYASDVEATVDTIPDVKPGRTVVFSRFEEDTASEEAVVLSESDADEDGRAALVRTIRATVFSALGLRLRTVRVVPVGTLVKTTSGKMSRADNAARFENALPRPHA